MAFGAFAPMPLRLGGSSTEGWSPEQHARLCADLVAVKYVAPLARWTYTKSGASATIHDYQGMNGAGLAYAPTAGTGADGVTGFIFDSTSFTDSYGVVCPFRVRHAIVSCHGTVELSASYVLDYVTTQITVFTFDNADVGIDCKVTVEIW